MALMYLDFLHLNNRNYPNLPKLKSMGQVNYQ